MAAKGLQNKKSLGQHWLKNREILEEIANLAVDDDWKEGATDKNSGAVGYGSVDGNSVGGDPARPCQETRPEVCLEIGPGLGTLTSSLLKRFRRVVAVEYDEKLARNLPRSFPGKNLEVVWQDFLQFDLAKIDEPYVVVGNIPYYITNQIIKKIITAENRPRRVVLLVQKEVAERIVGARESMLSLMVKNWATPKLGPVVLRGEFVPAPKVDSRVIVLEPHEPIVAPTVLELAAAGFEAPRKKVANNLSSIARREDVVEALKKNGKSPDLRAEELNLADWAELAKTLKRI